MPACNISSQKPAFKKDEKRGQKRARNSSPFLEPSSIGTITEGSENGPIFGPAFWCRRTTPELVLGVANLGTDREMPSNATSSSLDAAGQGKRPEHTFAFDSQVETCCVYSLTRRQQGFGALDVAHQGQECCPHSVVYREFGFSER